MLKQNKDGSWKIENIRDLDSVAEAIEEREEMLKGIEEQMEEQYDYLTIQEELANLKEALTSFMDKNDHANLQREGYKIVLVKSATSFWNEAKLKSLVPKPIWLKITKQVLDRDKLDDLVKEGTLDGNKIAPALETKPKKPYLRWFYADESAGEAEAKELERAMNG